MGIYKHILAMTDFSEDSTHSVKVAVELAAHYEADLTILHTAHDESQFNLVLTEEEYSKIKSRIDAEVDNNFKAMEGEIPELKELKTSYNTIVRRGIPYVEGLLEIEKNEYDLVVIGSHGRNSIKKFFYGSTAEKIVRRSHISVHITRL